MANFVWQNGVSDLWIDAAAWNLAAVPGAADSAFIAVPGGYTITLTTATSLASLTVNDASATLADETSGATVALSGNLTSYGVIAIDNVGFTGGTNWSVGGVLANAGTMTVGCGDGYGALTATASVTVGGGLNNTGTINLQGGVGPNQAIMNVAGAAGFGVAGTLTGNVNLSGAALLEFATGAIAEIDVGAELTLNGPNAFLANASSATSNSALTALAAVAGALNLENGAAVATATGLINTGVIYVDNGLFTGGSSLSVAGRLTNVGTMTIGSGDGYGALTAPVVVSAGGGLANSGTINLRGGVGPNGAALTVAGAAGFGAAGVLTGNVNVSGAAALVFGSGSISTIAAGAELTMNGPAAFIADSAAPTTNSALTGLSAIAGSLSLENGANVSVNGGLTNTGFLGVDNFGFAGGSSLAVAGQLANASTLTIGAGSGYAALSAPVSVTAASLANTGTINLQGGVSPIVATLNIAGAAGFGAAGVLTGNVNLSGDALLEFGSGSITRIAANAELTLQGAGARVADAGATTSSSALSGLGAVVGALALENGASVTTSAALLNSGFVYVDNLGFAGGSSLTVGGLFTNAGTLTIGSGAGYGALSSPVTVSALGGLSNAGTINLQGGLAPNLATLNVSGAAGLGAAGTIQGNVNLSGDALLEFGSGQIATIALGGELTLNGANARVADAGATASDSALTGLATVAGGLYLQNGAAVVSNVALLDSGAIALDAPGGSGGSSLTVAALTVSGSVQIGNAAYGNLIAPATVTAVSLVNTGAINLYGNASELASLNIAGAATNAGTLAIGATTQVSVGGAFTQTAGTTTVAGKLAAASITVTGGLLDFVAATGGTGPISIGSQGVVEFDAAVASGQSVAFASSLGTLELKAAGQFAGTISGFGGNDVIDLAGVSVASLSYSGDASGGTLTVNPTSGGAFTLAFAGVYTSASFAAVSDGQGGAEIVAAPLDAWSNASGGAWETGANWSGGAPSAVANALIALAGTYTVTLASAQIVASLTITDAAATLAVAAPGATDTVSGNLIDGGTVTISTASASGASTLHVGGVLQSPGGASVQTVNANSGGGSQLTLAQDWINGGTANIDAALGAGGSEVSVGGSLTNAGTINLDTQTDYGLNPSGASAIAIAGALNNSGTINLGNGSLTATSVVSAATLANSGTLNLQGANVIGTGQQAALDIAAAAPTIWTGRLSLAGQSLLQFGSGQIGGVASGAQIYLATSQGYIADAGATTSNSALTGLSSIAGDFELQYGATASLSGGLTITGSLNVDTQSNYGNVPSGGSSIAIGGALVNNGAINVGNGFFGALQLTSTATISAASLQNSGVINLNGNDTTTGSTKQARLLIAGAAPTIWTGALSMQGEALLQFGSGSIEDVAAGAQIYLASTQGYIADAASPTTNSALTGLSAIHGDFEEQYGVAVSLAGSLTVYGSLNIDTQSNYGNVPSGGSSIAIGGALVNDGAVNIGNGFFGALLLTSTATISAASLQNNGVINLNGNNTTTGSTKQADLIVASAAPSLLTGAINLNGEALLEFGSGQIAGIAAGASLYIGTPDGYVADQGATTSNSALQGLTSNAGTLNLEFGASLSLTGGLTNSGTLDVGASNPSGWFNTPSGVVTVGAGFSAEGVVENSGVMNFGVAGQPLPTVISFGGLQNDASGVIGITGAASVATTVTVGGAAQSVWMGSLSLNGDASLQYASGQFVAIASGASIYEGAAGSGVFDAGSSAPNSALSGIQSNAGTLNFENGAVAALSGSLRNTGTLDVNVNGGSGGVNFALAGTLNNQAQVNIGSTGQSGNVITSFGGVVNSSTGTINVSAYIYSTAFDVAGALVNAGAVNISFGVHAAVAGFSNTGNVTISGVTGVPTSFEVIGAASNGYNLTVGAFAQMGVTGAFVDSGYLTVAGSLDLQSGMDVTAGGYLTLNNGAIILPTSAPVTIDQGAIVAGYGNIGGAVANSGAITASGGALDIAGAITGTGTLAIAANAGLELGGATAQAVNFGGNVGTLKLDAPASFTGAIAGLALGDTIDLVGVQATSAFVSGSTLTVAAGAQTYSYRVAGAGLSGNLFSIQNDGAGGSNLVLGPPGPTISAPKTLTTFNSLSALLGPIAISDPTAGAQPLQVVISDTSGLLGALPAGAGAVAGNFTNQITLSGDLADVNTELASLVYGANVNGDDQVTVTVTDGGGKFATQRIAVTTKSVPYTPAVINFPQPAYVLPTAITGFNGVSVSDPYAQATGQTIPLTFAADGTLTLTANTPATITGQGTNLLTVTGTVDQLNADFGDGLAESVGSYALGAFGLSGEALAQKALDTLIAAAVGGAVGGSAGAALDAAFKELTSPPDFSAESLVGGLAGAEGAWFEFGVQAASFALNSVVAAIPGNEPAEPGDFLKAAVKLVLHAAGVGGHIVLPNGQSYTLDAAGEFTLAKSNLPGDSLNVQIRLQPVAGGGAASETTQVAAAVGSDIVTFDPTRAATVWINGAAASIASGQSIDLNGGVLIKASATTYQIVYNTGEVVTVVNQGGYLDAAVAPGPNERAGDVVGLAATGANAFVLPDGTALPSPISAADFQSFVNAWRVSQATSLFNYGAGQTTATFTNLAYPSATLSLGDFPAALVQQAHQVVVAAGIVDPGAQQAAEYDYIVSGGSSAVVAADANAFQGLTLSSLSPAPPAASVAIGVYAPTQSVAAVASGPTNVTFDVYLTAPAASATTVNYAIVADDATEFTAAAFGGTLPTGSITIAAGALSGQIVIAVPQGALGTNAQENLAIRISSPASVPVVAPTTQTAVYQPEPGPPAVVQLEYLGAFGTLTRSGDDYTLDLGAIQPGEPIPALQFGVVNAAAAPADQLTGAFHFASMIGFSVAGAAIPTPIGAGGSYEGLQVVVNEAKFGGNSETIVFNPIDVNASGYSSPLSPITLTITDTLELPGLVYSTAWGDVHIVTYNGLKYDFQGAGDFTLAKSNVAGDNFDIQLRLAPWYSGAPVTTIQAVALQVGGDRVTIDWTRASTVYVDGVAESLSSANPTMTLAGGVISYISPTVYKVNWSTGETVTVSENWALNGLPYITVVDGVRGNAGPGAYSGLQGEDAGQGNDFQLPDGTVLPQPLTSAELYGVYAKAWNVTSGASLFYTTGATYTAPTNQISLADLPASVVAAAAQLVAAAGITDPGIAQAAELDYIATGDPSFLSAAANMQQVAKITSPATVAPSAPAPAELGVEAAAAKVTQAASGATIVTFDVYLTSAASTPTTVNFTVASPGAGYFGASTFGGALPSGSITLAANATSGQFTIALPQGALGGLPDENLQVQISSPGGAVPVFAPTAQTEVVNAAPQAGAAAVPVLGYLGAVGAFSFDAATNTYTLDLGGLIQDSQQFAANFSISNAAPQPGDSLAGSFSAPAGKGFLVTGNSLSAPIAAGASYFGLQATVDPTSLGANGETLVFSPTDVNDSGYSAALAPITLKIVDTVEPAAAPRVNTPTTIVFNNVHVGGVDQQHVSIANTALAGSAGLDVKLTASGDATASGAVAGLAPGATDATSLIVGVDTSQAGARGGSVQETFTSDTGATTSPIFVDNPSLDVFGGVYRLATASILPNPIIVRVGDSGDDTITIANTDPNDGYSENLIATVVGTTGALTAQGSTGEIAAQGTGSLHVAFSTATPGPIGTVTLDLQSDGTGVDGLGVTDLGQVTIPVSVTSGARPAAPQFELLSGGGAWTQSGASYSLNLGSIDAPTTVGLGVLNGAAAPADALSGSFAIAGSSAFANSGFSSFSGLAAGSADTALSVTLGGGPAGAFSETITLSPVDSGAVALAPLTLTISGTVTDIAPTLNAPTNATIYQNEATAIGPLSVSDSDPYAPNETFTVVLLDIHGALSANASATGGGGTITGAGTNALEIVGSLAQVNADLTTLADTDASSADDILWVAVKDGRGGVDRASVKLSVVQQTATVTIAAIDGNNVINYAQAHAASGVALSGTVSGLAAGATFSVSVADGGFSKSYAATVNAAATGWTATIPQADASALPNGIATISAVVTGTGGVVLAQASDSVTVAETLPTVTIAAVAGDNVINYAEAHAAAGVALSGTVSGLAAGATFSVSVADGGFSKSYVASVNAAATGWTATIPQADAGALPNGIATISAQVADVYGNVSAPASDSVTVAETLPTVTIAAVDGNNVINYAEAHAAAGVALSGTVSGLAAGATFSVSVADGGFSKSYAATVNAAATGWTATIPQADASALPNGIATISAQVADVYGNVSAPASDSVTVAETLPTVTIAAVDGNNVINYAEAHAAAGVALSGTVSGLAAGATFSVSVADGGFSKSYAATVNAAATGWTATIPQADASALPNGIATISAQVADVYGNVSAQATDSVTVQETTTIVSIAPVTGDNVINYAEAHAAAGVALSGTVSGLSAGATFSVSVADAGFAKSYAATVNLAATGWTATIPQADASALPNGIATLTAIISGAGGVVLAQATDSVTVAEKLPTVSINPINGDDVIDNKQSDRDCWRLGKYNDGRGGHSDSEEPSNAALSLSGAVSGLAAGASFQVGVADGGFSKSYTATVNAAGTGWTAAMPGADVAQLPNGTAIFTAAVTDVYGNVSAPAAQKAKVEGTTPVVLSVTANPASGDFGAGKTIEIILKMNEAVSVCGTPALQLNDCGVATYNAKRSTSTSLAFDYIVAAGQNTSNMTIEGVALSCGASISDGFGDLADLSGADRALGLVIDTAPPKVKSVTASPAHGEAKTGQGVAITLGMSEAVAVAGSPWLLLNDGGVATYDAAHSSAKSLVFDYTPGAHDVASALQVLGVDFGAGSSIGDGAGNAALLASAGSPLGLMINTTSSHANGSGPGTAIVAAGGEVELFGGAAEAVTFASHSSGLLLLDQPGAYSGSLSGFGGGDEIDLAGLRFGSHLLLQYSAHGGAGGVLTIQDPGYGVAHLNLNGSYSAGRFSASSDGGSGTLVKYT